MISLLIIFILPVVAMILVYRDERNNSFDGVSWWWVFTIGLIFLVIGIFICIVISNILDMIYLKEMYKVGEVNIYALDGNFETEGDFFLGTGSVDEDLEYYYLVKRGEGYKVKSVKAKEVTIYYSDNPRIERCRERYKSEFLEDNFGIGNIEEEYRIYIPEGSIKHNYKPVPFDD